MVNLCYILLYIDARILELGTVRKQIYVMVYIGLDHTIYAHSNFGTQIKIMVYICCNPLSMHIQILELGTVGTQI